jgi:hypothetical protein
MKAAIWLLALIACGVASSASAEVKFEWSTERDEALKLAAKLPVVDTESINCPPFDAEIRMNLAEGGYVTYMQFRRPGRIIAIMRDQADGSPAILYHDGLACFFEAETPRFVALHHHKLDFLLAPNPKNQRIDLNGRIGFGKDSRRRVHIDLAGIMALPGRLRNLGSTADVIRLERQRPDQRDEVELRLNQEPPICVFRSWMSASPEPGVVLKLRLHSTETQPLLDRPDLDKIRGALSVDEPKPESEVKDIASFAIKMKVIAEMIRAGHAHFGVWHPGCRNDCKIPGFSTPDWETIRRNKTELGPRLSVALGLKPLSLDDDDSKPIVPELAADESTQSIK